MNLCFLLSIPLRFFSNSWWGYFLLSFYKAIHLPVARLMTFLGSWINASIFDFHTSVPIFFRNINFSLLHEAVCQTALPIHRDTWTRLQVGTLTRAIDAQPARLPRMCGWILGSRANLRVDRARESNQHNQTAKKKKKMIQNFLRCMIAANSPGPREPGCRWPRSHARDRRATRLLSDVHLDAGQFIWVAWADSLLAAGTRCCDH